MRIIPTGLLKLISVSVTLQVLAAIAPASYAQTASIDAGTIYQTMDGFGASTGYVEQNNNMNSAQAASYFSSSSGIGLSWIRIQDCGSDTDCASSGSTSYTPDLATLKLAVAQGAKVFITFDYPSGDASYYSSMTAYAVGRIAYLQSQGVPVSAIGPENEPGNGNDFTNALEDTWIDALGAALHNAGYNIPIAMPESGANYVYDATINPRGDFFSDCMSDSTCESYVSYAAQHGYSTWPFGPAAHYTALPSSIGSRHSWQTEVDGNINGAWSCSVDSDPVWDPSIHDGIGWAENIHDFLTNQNGSLWMYWNLQSGHTEVGPNGCNDGLADMNFNPAKRFYTVGNWSKFVRPGWVRIAATPTPQSGLYLTAFMNQSTGAFAIVAINSNSGSVSQSFSLNGLSSSSVTPYITDGNNNLVSQAAISFSNDSFTATLNASSVTTFVSSSGPAAPMNLTGSLLK
jgi:glucuronoarabinoxylan endo-1,4-beta-xylanase